MRFNSAQLLTMLVLAPLLTHLGGITGATLAVIFGTIMRDIGMGFLLPVNLGLRPGV